MIEPHTHDGMNSPRINPRDLGNGGLFTADLAISAQGLGSMVQRGTYALTAGKQFVTFPVYYTSANSVNNLVIILTPTSAPGSTPYRESIAAAVGSLVSGFTVSGSGSDTGYYFAVGYR